MKFRPLSEDGKTVDGFVLTPENDSERFALESLMLSTGAKYQGDLIEAISAMVLYKRGSLSYCAEDGLMVHAANLKTQEVSNG